MRMSKPRTWAVWSWDERNLVWMAVAEGSEKDMTAALARKKSAAVRLLPSARFLMTPKNQPPGEAPGTEIRGLAVEDVKRKDRPGDQPLPVPNDGPSMHDLVCEDLKHRPWLLQAGAVAVDVQARKLLGLERYDSLLQAHNGRDALLDLYEELLDAVAYARQVQEERNRIAGSLAAVRIYEELLGVLNRVRRLRNELS